MFWKLQNLKNCAGYTWGSHQANFCKATKENIIDANASHHGSKCSYYLFGKSGNYELIDYSSVALYVSKKYKNQMINTLWSINANILEEMAAFELKSAVNGMKRTLPNINEFIAPILNTAYQILKEIGDCNMNK